MEMGNEATVAGLIALALGLVKVLEVTVTWAFKKLSPKEEKAERAFVVQLDSEVSRMIRDTHDRVHTIHEIQNVKDHDGTPLVYSSRSLADDVQAVAACVRDVSASQERIVDVLEKIDEKVDDGNDKLDDVLKVVKR